MKRILLPTILLTLFALVAPAVAQPPGGPGGGGRFGAGGFGGGGFGAGGFGGGGPGGGLTEMLRRRDVRDELELVDDQVRDLEALAEKLQTRIRDELAKLREPAADGDRADRFAAMRETFGKVAEDAEKEVGQVLLPHQMKRLKQLQNQMRMQGGSTRALTDGSLAEDLNISDEQKERLREAAAKVEQELRQKLAELRKDAQEKLLAELTSEQRAKYKELVGDPFEFQRVEPARTFGQPGGREGQPGGRAGQFGRGGRPQRDE